MKYIARLHPFLFVLASIVFLYPQSAIIVSPGQVVRSILVLWLALIFLAGLAFWLARDLDWAPGSNDGQKLGIPFVAG